MPDFLTNFAAVEQNDLRDKLVSLTVQSLSKIDMINANVHTVEVRADLIEALNDINEAFSNIQSNRLHSAQNWIDKVIAPTISAGFASKSILDERLQLQFFENATHIPVQDPLQIPIEDEEFKAPLGCGILLLQNQ